MLCTYPMEHMAAQTLGVNPEPTWRLYAALAEVAGVAPEVRVHDPRVIAGEMVHEEARLFTWFINASDAPLRCTPVIATGELSHLDGKAAGAEIALDAFGVVVLGLFEDAPTCVASAREVLSFVRLCAPPLRLSSPKPSMRRHDVSSGPDDISRLGRCWV